MTEEKGMEALLPAARAIGRGRSEEGTRREDAGRRGRPGKAAGARQVGPCAIRPPARPWQLDGKG